MMPIKDKSIYPHDWKHISLAVRRRANGCCEFCGVENYAVGARDRYGNWHDMDAIDSMSASEGDMLFEEYPKMIKIVLTVAHLDHNTRNNKLDNLKALCQKCHLTYDAKYHAANAKVTRSRKKEEAIAATGQLKLLDD